MNILKCFQIGIIIIIIVIIIIIIIQLRLGLFTVSQLYLNYRGCELSRVRVVGVSVIGSK